MEILQLLLTLVAGAGGAFLAAELVKFIPQLPEKGGAGDVARKVALRATAGVAAMAFTLLGNWFAGDAIDPANVQDVLVGLVQAAIAWYTAHKAYAVVKPVDKA